MKFYITTPIYYPNGRFHTGSAYTTIFANAINLYKKQRGYETLFLTGTDEHGQKMETKAKEEGISPKDFVDKMSSDAKELWKKLDISYDIFMRTTYVFHEEAIQKIFTKFLEKGDIYLGKYKGKYCISCETFFTESKLNNGKCPDCGKDVIEMEEEAYFFNMQKYKDKLIDFYNENPDFLLPQFRKNEIFNSFINEGIEDLCVTRTSFDWGIPVRENPKHKIYVWLDALFNYLTALGFENNEENKEEYFKNTVHIVGKDIIRFHAIYWPIFLIALDLPMPKHIFAHNWFLGDDGRKMSKSIGNVIYPDDVSDIYGSEALKHYLLKTLQYDRDTEFSYEGFVENYNSYLANDLGNLVSRTVGMINSYSSGKLLICENKLYNEDNEIKDYLFKTKQNFEKYFDNFEMSKAIEEIWKGISRINKYIDEIAPWNLFKIIKSEDVLQEKERNDAKEKMEEFLVTLVNSVKRINILIYPILEKTSYKISEIFGFNDEILYEKYDKKLEIDIIPKDEDANLFKRLDKKVEIERLKNLTK